MKIPTLTAISVCFCLSAIADGTNEIASGYRPVITNKVTISLPSDLLANGAKGTTPYSQGFVFNDLADFRLMYCDDRTLHQRISSGICVIDTEVVNNQKEIKVSSAGSLLGDVLKNSGIRRLKNLTGRTHGQIRLISKDAILSCNGDDFLLTKIFPGDFIVVLPTY
jgi:hypothetical protein